MSTGIAALNEAQRAAILQAIIAFDDFTADNDPYGEHDFGVIEHPDVG